jgi:hypothetical protein
MFASQLRPQLLSDDYSDGNDDDIGPGLNPFFQLSLESVERAFLAQPGRRQMDLKDRIVSDGDPGELVGAPQMEKLPEEELEGGYERQQESVEAQWQVHGRPVIRRSDDSARLVVSRRRRGSVVFERELNEHRDEFADEDGWKPQLVHSRESAERQANERAKAELRARAENSDGEEQEKEDDK